MSVVQVHLTTWAVDDGAVDPFGLGDRVELGLGIAVEQLPILADAGDADGVTPVPMPAERGRVRARADVVGPAQLVLDAGGSPFAALVTPLPEVPLVLIGPGGADPEWTGSRLVVRGDVVVEPYLWGEGGLFRASIRHCFRGAIVERIQTLAAFGQIGTRAEFVDVGRVVPHRINGLDYLIDLRFDPL